MSTPTQKYILSICCFFLAFACLTAKEGYGSTAVIQHPYEKEEAAINIDLFNRSLAYNFKVADKLNGNGNVQLSLSKNKITGNAIGLGLVRAYKVDLLTSLTGSVDKETGLVSVNLNGTADPVICPFPGKVKFTGPLKGTVKDGAIKLVGTVQVEGFLARRTGFNQYEEVVIEILDSKII